MYATVWIYQKKNISALIKTDETRKNLLENELDGYI